MSLTNVIDMSTLLSHYCAKYLNVPENTEKKEIKKDGCRCPRIYVTRLYFICDTSTLHAYR